MATIIVMVQYIMLYVKYSHDFAHDSLMLNKINMTFNKLSSHEKNVIIYTNLYLTELSLQPRLLLNKWNKKVFIFI